MSKQVTQNCFICLIVIDCLFLCDTFYGFLWHYGFLLFDTFSFTKSLGTMGIQRLQVTLEPTAARLRVEPP